MPIYSVSVEFCMVVQAEDASHAYQIAESNMRDAISDCEAAIFVNGDLKEVPELPSGWDGMCLPYGGNGVDRLKDILEAK